MKISPEGRVTLRNVGWETYEMLVEEDPDRSAPRFFYDRGEMEIMSPSFEHEQIAEITTSLVNELAMELEMDVVSARSTTFKREDILRGFEPDASFYFPPNAAKVRGKRRLSLDEGDPPPDLVIEVDITNPSSSKLPIYARLKVPEVWRHDGEKMEILALRDENYAKVPESRLLASAKVSSESLTRLVGEGMESERPVWTRKARGWARGLRA
jgi:Uma2 family endonuclease